MVSVDLIERERRRVESLGARAIAKIGHLACRHSSAAIRMGHDPVEAAQNVFLGNERINQGGVGEVLARMMMLAYLTGRRRAVLESPRQTNLSRESDKIDDDRKKLLLLLLLTEDDVSTIQSRLDAEAQYAAEELWGSVERRLEDAVDGLRAAGLPHVSSGVGETTAVIESPPSISRAVRLIGESFAASGVVPDNDYAARNLAAAGGVREYERGKSDGFGLADTAAAPWGWVWRTVGDDAVCPICAPLEGMAAPVGDPVWNELNPGLHWRCRCTRLPVWRSEIEPRIVRPDSLHIETAIRSKRRFEGDAFGA